MTRSEVISEILSVWHQEIGGDVVFRKAYDALWTDGPPKQWTGDEFFKEFQWMKRLLPRLHPNDIAILWAVSCGGGKTMTVVDIDGNYSVSA